MKEEVKQEQDNPFVQSMLDAIKKDPPMHGCLLPEDWVYIWNPEPGKHKGRGEHELYERGDSHQTKNLYALQPGVGPKLSTELLALKESLETDRLVWEGDELSDEMHEQLEALGYVDE